MTFTQVDIKPQDWQAFCEFVSASKDAIFVSDAERNFRDSFVLTAGAIPESNKLWIRVLRDKISEALHFTV